jgi:alpha-tubulin suppressor-like RCC1 family protein
VSADGRVTAVSAGPVRITADVEGIRGTVSLLIVGATSSATTEPTTGTSGNPTTVAPTPLATATRVFAGGARSCARTAETTVCWGLGRAELSTISSDLTDVSVGLAHACGLTRSGGAVCWGENRDGQLGTGSGPARATPAPVPIPGGESIRQVTAGGDHSCALTASGKAFCWGKNSFGQLGDGTQGNKAAPVAVRTTATFRAISAGSTHTCAIGTDNAVYCWGDDFSGAVGVGLNERVPEPANIDKGRYAFTSVYAGRNSTCALTAQGEAYCWGENRYAQVGVGSMNDRQPIGKKVQRDVRFTSLALGARHVCGLSLGGELFCWGDNVSGQLGNGTSGERRGLMVPTEVQTSTRFSSIGAGASHTCAVAQDGGVYCWGDNSGKQLGALTDAKVVAPTRLPGSSP